MDSDQVANVSPLDGLSVTDVLKNLARPFRGEYYVDPAAPVSFRNGSQAFPFASVADAFSAAAVAGYSGAVIWLPAKAALLESIAFPNGGDWEIAVPGNARASITGNMSCSSVAQTVCRLTNIVLSGSLSGVANSGGGNFLYVTNSLISGAVNMTGSGPGYWFVVCDGYVTTFFSFGGAFQSTCNVAGGILAKNWSFAGAVDVTSTCGMDGCRVPASFKVGAVGAEFTNCITAGAMVITGTGASVVLMDGYTYRYALQNGLTFNGCVLKTNAANASAQKLVSANVPIASFTGSGGLAPKGLYEVIATQELMAPGIAGASSVNIHYVDMRGVAQVVTITPPLPVAVAGAPAVQGAFYFSHNGSAPINYSVSGITTPGTLSIDLNVAIRRVN